MYMCDLNIYGKIPTSESPEIKQQQILDPIAARTEILRPEVEGPSTCAVS